MAARIARRGQLFRQRRLPGVRGGISSILPARDHAGDGADQNQPGTGMRCGQCLQGAAAGNFRVHHLRQRYRRFAAQFALPALACQMQDAVQSALPARTRLRYGAPKAAASATSALT